MRLKIGIAIDLVHKIGGTQRSTWEIAEHLGREHDVTLITKKSFATGDESFRCYVIGGLSQIPYLGNIYFAWKVSLLKRSLGLDILNVQGSNGLWQDVVTAQSVHKKWFVWSLKEIPFLSKPWILKVCNPIHYIVIAIEQFQYLKFFHKKVIAISDQVKRDLITYFAIDPSRIVVVHHGVNVNEFAPKSPNSDGLTIRQNLNISRDMIVGIFVAHEFKRKGLSILLKALSMVPKKNICLIVVGRDNPDLFISQAKKLNVQNRVHFVGEQKDVKMWYAAADFFVFPTSYEAFGMVITEAMASGLPVIVPRDAGAAELINHGVDGLLLDRWDNADQIAEHMIELSTQDNRERLGQAARECAASRTWAQAANETLEVYRGVLQKELRADL